MWLVAVSEPEAEARAALSVARVNDAARTAYDVATAFEASLIAPSRDP